MKAFLLLFALTLSEPFSANAERTCGLVSDQPFEFMLAFGGHRSFELAQALLKHEGPISGIELFDRVDQPKGTFYTVLTRMVDARLVKKEFSDEDRRVAHYSLTAKGRRWATSRAPTTYRVRVGSKYSTIGYQEARILLALGRSPETTAGQIRDSLKIPIGIIQSALSRLVEDALVSQTFVSRFHPKVFSLTRAGEAATQRISTEIREFMGYE